VNSSPFSTADFVAVDLADGLCLFDAPRIPLRGVVPRPAKKDLKDIRDELMINNSVDFRIHRRALSRFASSRFIVDA
jgi:hypothetical protein